MLKLNEYIIELKKISLDSDIEYAHIDADGLMLDLIRELTEEINDENIRKEVDVIIDAYYAVPKWYA